MANFYLALEHNLTIIPVLTKIDQTTSDVEKTEKEIIETLGFEKEEILKVSAKSNINCELILPEIIKKVPHPKGDKDKPFKSLLFDSWFDEYFGATCMVNVLDGKIAIGDKISLFHSKRDYTVKHLGIMNPFETPTKNL